MIGTVSPTVLKLLLFLVTAVATHLMMSFGQTLIHYKVAHHLRGGKIYRNHINFHHTHYSNDHLVSGTYLGDEGNTTPYFFIPILLVGGCAYWLLPLSFFAVIAVACAASFYVHVLFRQGIPFGTVLASAVRMVQTQTRAAFRSSSARG